MTVLSVNLNKVALLRNSRGRDFPNLVSFAQRFLNLGVKGITVHPRPDERHVTRQDVYDLADFLNLYPDVEFNIEGYPSQEFMKLVSEVKPAQCTLVPDEPSQLTSDHGWDVVKNHQLLISAIKCLKDYGIRSSLFLDPKQDLVAEVQKIGTDRVELYTEEFANHFDLEAEYSTFEKYQATALAAQEVGLGVNAGHDLDLKNLRRFLQIPNILEVSIGHALIVECLIDGMDKVVMEYLAIVAGEETLSNYY